MEVEKIIICDKCNDRKGRYNCVICKKDLCSGCNNRINLTLDRGNSGNSYSSNDNKLILKRIDCCSDCSYKTMKIKRVSEMPPKIIDELGEILKNLLTLNELENESPLKDYIKK